MTLTLTLTLTLDPNPNPNPHPNQGELAVVSGGLAVDGVKSGDVFGESAMIYDVRRLIRGRVRAGVRVRVR